MHRAHRLQPGPCSAPFSKGRRSCCAMSDNLLYAHCSGRPSQGQQRPCRDAPRSSMQPSQYINGELRQLVLTYADVRLCIAGNERLTESPAAVQWLCNTVSLVRVWWVQKRHQAWTTPKGLIRNTSEMSAAPIVACSPMLMTGG